MVLMEHVKPETTVKDQAIPLVSGLTSSTPAVSIRLSANPQGTPSRIVVLAAYPDEPGVVFDLNRPKRATPNLIADLGWSQAQAAETRAKLAAFEDDWAAPEMDAYDAL